MTEDGGSWTVGGGSWSSRVAWPGGHRLRSCLELGPSPSVSPAWPRQRRIDVGSMFDVWRRVLVSQVDSSTDAACRMPDANVFEGWQSG